MGLKDMFNKLWGKDIAPTTSGAAKAASGRSDLSSAAEKLNDMRGDAVLSGGNPVNRPQDDKIADIVATAKATKNPEVNNGGTVVENFFDR